MKKKVLHLLNSSSYSGAENIVISIINNMGDSYECAYASMDGPIRTVLAENGIQFIPVKKVTISEVRRIEKLFKPDIIHAHDYTTSIISAISHVKATIISHLHNNAPWIKTYHPYSFMYLLSSLRYKKILTVSKSICDEYVFGKLIKKKSLVVLNPIDLSGIIRKSKQKNNDNKKYNIVFLGRLTQAKNPLKFIEIMNKVVTMDPNIKIAIIGDGNLKSQCQKKINNLNLENNIELLGFKSNPYVILSSAKMLCMTSDWEGFGLVALEALTLGLPVLATPTGGLQEILDDKCALLTNDEDVYVKEINRLLMDSKYWNRKSLEAKRRAQEFNNIDKYIKNLKEIYIN